VPFHLLTKEFYTLVKQRLAPQGAAAFNVHDGTKLYSSTLMTLRAVFPSVHLFSSGTGEMIPVATAEAAPDAATLAHRAKALQEKYRFRFELPALLARRTERSGATQTGQLLTDDFAPAALYDTIGGEKRRKK
jgi:spermidine synthase